MKQIIPFKKELLFKTKVSEITSISLEHTLSLTKDDLVSGKFHISGDYKMTEGSINREKFYFTCPFEINLDANYDNDSLIIDIDNFYYEVINNESLQVNIDVYIEGEKIEEPEPVIETRDILDEEEITTIKNDLEISSEIVEDKVDERTENSTSIDDEDIKKDTRIKNISPSKTVSYYNPPKVELEDESENITNNVNINQNKEFNVFNDLDSSDTYVTYYVYIVKEEDNIDKILDKFNVTKEDLENYNDITNVKPKDKLIIPAYNE